ncbi:MAG TPA: restriction endonuclease subunit S [Marinilabiliaceae bacterium]|nr:restriction endonuclease subunit S [Marinilabiliaceae bacterium]
MSTTTPHTQTAYKDTPIGKIPADWEVKKLGEVADIDKESLSSNTPKDYKFDYISLSDVDSEDFNIQSTKQIFETAPSRARRIVRKDDILLSTVRPNLQGFSIIRDEVKDLIASTGFAVISCKNIYNEYLFQFLFGNSIQKQFYQLLVGSNYPAINSSDVKKLKIPLPPLSEQKRIAEVLSTWDQAIQLTEQLIRQKEQRKKWLMQNLLTGKMRLKGFSGEWKECKLGDFIEESRIPSIHNDVNRRITVKLNLKGVEKREVRGSEAEDATYFFIRKKGQFIYGKQNLHKGAFGIIPEELDGFESSQDIPSFDFKENVIPKFFLLFMSQEQFYKSLEKISTGTGSKRIHPENLYKVKVKFPSLEEQTAIAEILQTADKEIELLKAKAEQLKEQKKGLMQQLLTGKKRLL